jgi:hypothetical protein
MDKLEQYLDQVCRHIGGPKALRQHLRQELGEHLRDAVAEHRAAGLSEEQALNRALEDFGGPEQVRSELEATHGRRLMAVVIDKAMQWKERTMKARWLWTSWAHLTLMGVIALEVAWISFAVIVLVPKFQKILQDGILGDELPREPAVAWMAGFLQDVTAVGEYGTWLVLAVAVAWAIFEWRVRSENKPFMRLSVFGTAAVALLVVSVLMAASLVIPLMMGIPSATRFAPASAVKDMVTIDTAISALEQALAQKKWEAIQEHTKQASGALSRLADVGPSVAVLASRYEQPKVDELRKYLKSAKEGFLDMELAIQAKDARRLEEALQRFRQSYAPVREWAMSLAR